MEACIPFIDAHTHAHGLNYDAWETLGMIGTKALVLSAGNPHVYRELHQDVPDLEDTLRYWEGPIRLSAVSEEKHFFNSFVAIGISFMTRVQQWERALDLMPDYLEKPEVIAVGESGIDPVQYFGMQWPIEEQRVVLKEQVRIAKDYNLPFILHTPTPKKKRDFLMDLAAHDLPKDGYKQHFLEMDLEVINEVGLDHKLLVIDHVDETIIDFVLEETDAYIGIGVGQKMRHTDPRFFTDVIENYGPERIMINTDHVPYVSCDLFAIPKAIREMRRRGITEDIIRKVVFENANTFYGLDLENS